MKRVLYVCLALAAASASAQTRDGEWFGKIGELGQLAFISGFVSGVETGANAAAYNNCRNVAIEALAACIQPQASAVHEGYLRFLAGLTVPQIHKGVVTFYSDYRNIKVSVEYAVLHTGKSIAGVPSDELEQSLEAARRFASGNLR